MLGPLGQCLWRRDSPVRSNRLGAILLGRNDITIWFLKGLHLVFQKLNVFYDLLKYLLVHAVTSLVTLNSLVVAALAASPNACPLSVKCTGP
jgi:hypothetical protein